ncbi:MAG TPA: T9SS type A sorting domain-containing protein, partial [Bacteroidota bacterium]
PQTTIRHSVPKKSPVLLKVFNLLGQEVKTLVDAEFEAGVYSVSFDASDLPSGIYVYRLSAGTFVETKRMVLLK